jgi:hypothetical protein
MMMPNWDDFEILASRLAGALGALVSMRFLNGTILERSLMAVGGAAFSFYASAWTAQKLSIPEGLCGFLLGLFGMSILSRLWEWLQTTNALRDFLDAWLRRKP